MFSNGSLARYEKRRMSIRKKISGSEERPRLSISRSSKHIIAQAIDDTKGTTVAYATSEAIEGKAKKAEKAKLVGATIAKLLLAKNIDKVVFDRNGNLFHGRVAAVAAGAREAGLKF